MNQRNSCIYPELTNILKWQLNLPKAASRSLSSKYHIPKSTLTAKKYYFIYFWFQFLHLVSEELNQMTANYFEKLEDSFVQQIEV